MPEIKTQKTAEKPQYLLSAIYSALILMSMSVLMPAGPTSMPTPEPAPPVQIAPAPEQPEVRIAKPLQPPAQITPSTYLASTAGQPEAEPAPASTVKYPGLPDYPHRQFQYRTLATPSGPLYPMEPFLSRISADIAWDAPTTGPAPTIAVIDTGFSLAHDNLASRWATNLAETAGSLQDNDLDGYIGNWRGWDFVHNMPDPAAGQDDPAAGDASHGTMTAGLAGLMDATARILPLQALDDTGSGYTDAVAAAVHYAADHGARIISLSLGSSSDDPYLHAQVDYAIAKGAVVVAAAGNTNCDCLIYPAAYPEVIAVGASTATDTRAGFSSYGANLDLLAPGTAGDVCSSFYSPADPVHAYSCGFSGTSFAAPIVAGTAALLLHVNPAANYLDLTSALIYKADKTAFMAGQNYTPFTGYGRLNTAASVESITTFPSVPLGQLLNKHWGSLTATSLDGGPYMDSTCIGPPGAVCQLKLIGPGGQSLALPEQVLDPIYGGTEFYWNAEQAGLTPGGWQVLTVITLNGTGKSSAADLLIISP